MGRDTTIKWIRARFNSKCAGCGDPLYEGDLIAYDFEEKAAYCTDCGENEEERQQAQQRNSDYTRPSKRFEHDDIDDFEDCD